MTIEQAVLERLKQLPPDRQREVLDFTDFLREKEGHLTKQPRKSLEGIWADLGVKITEQDIADARQEMWGNFPRDIDL